MYVVNHICVILRLKGMTSSQFLHRRTLHFTSQVGGVPFHLFPWFAPSRAGPIVDCLLHRDSGLGEPPPRSAAPSPIAHVPEWRQGGSAGALSLVPRLASLARPSASCSAEIYGYWRLH